MNKMTGQVDSGMSKMKGQVDIEMSKITGQVTGNELADRTSRQ